MKVILTADIKNVGVKGEEKEVKPGYARNFLFPNGLAVTADSALGQDIIASKMSESEKQLEAIEKVAKIASANQDLELTFERKSSSAGKLFGSVSVAEIKSEAEKKLGLQIESITPDTAIKEVGKHRVTLDLPGQQMLDITVVINPLKEKKK